MHRTIEEAYTVLAIEAAISKANDGTVEGAVKCVEILESASRVFERTIGYPRLANIAQEWTMKGVAIHGGPEFWLERVKRARSEMDLEFRVRAIRAAA